MKMQHEWWEDMLPREKRAAIQHQTDQFLGKQQTQMTSNKPRVPNQIQGSIQYCHPQLWNHWGAQLEWIPPSQARCRCYSRQWQLPTLRTTVLPLQLLMSMLEH
jgi:hypothetical protein